MIIRTHAFARAGLVGNPSDGYYGKTISIVARQYKAEVVLYESPELVIEPSEQDISRFSSMAALIQDVRRHGYYGGVRLIKAAVRRFGDYCAERGVSLPRENFTIQYTSDIPRLVGMAGSSAIVTATLRALMEYYEVKIPKPDQANLILSVENKELGIGAGLQDRVIQVYEGAVYMDFSKDLMDRDGHGRYEELDPALLPPLYVAFDPLRAEGSERFHNHVHALFEEGDEKVVAAMREFAALAQQARDLLLAGRGGEIGPVLDRNFDLRASIYRLSDENLRMVRTARSVGASAKFAGSGGAIIGTYADEAMFDALAAALGAIGCRILKPQVS
ncbi:MAG: GHMP kinase [Kiritimatiellae bacterium]|nr:GHMP kinase [Kiritimatiellia bacterium]